MTDLASVENVAEARLQMVHELHTAVFGSTWARSAPPKEVWEMLLNRVRDGHPSGLIERVAAHALKVGDCIIVDSATDEYVGNIIAIEEYTVHWPPPKRQDMEANTRCLVLRLPHLNTYRAIHDTVRRVVAS